MPTYEYECTACTYQFERFQPITAKPVRTCPKCKKRVKRLIGTGGGILFKGSGFYQTDYRSDSYKKRAESEKSASSGKKAAESKPGASGKEAKKN